MSSLRLLLLPFAWLYGGVLALRHTLYNTGILRSIRPTVPTIVVGNLALGGTGKTPMLELILTILRTSSPLATLSRGYGRSGTNLREVRSDDTADAVGDEPLQVKMHFPEARVFVGADRVNAIDTIQATITDVKAVLLDDAFQHRRLNGSLNILLTTFQRPWSNDHLLPAGNLRDVRSRRKAAQVVVVTKCPALPSGQEQTRWRERLGLWPDQDLFFSGIEYGEPKLSVGIEQATSQQAHPTTDNYLLFTGIADPAPLLSHLRSAGKNAKHIAFADHHAFSAKDLESLAGRYAKFATGPKMLLTTEKDFMRLRSVIIGSPLQGLPLAVIGMRTVILNEPGRFATLIHHHVTTHQAHR